jgi:hypothetical protein
VRERIEEMVRAICREPEAVRVQEAIADDAVMYTVSTSPQDVGRVIGRNGDTARALERIIEAMVLRDGLSRSVFVRVRQPERRG